MSRSSLQLEAAALSVPCAVHQVPAGAPCPDGGACMDRYGVSPGQWSGWFGCTCPALWQDRVMLQLLGFIIDCPDPMKLAAFYSELTGRAIMEGSGDSMAGITIGEVDLAFQRVENYRPPRWPDDEHPKQYHLDFEVGEIEAEQRRA